MKLRLMFLGKQQFKGQRPHVGYRQAKFLKGAYLTWQEWDVTHCFYLWRFALTIKFD